MMAKSLTELFGIDFNVRKYISLANNVVTEQTIRKVKDQETIIEKHTKEIADKFPTVAQPSSSDINQIKQKFFRFKSGNIVENSFSNNEIRKTCYFANQIATSVEDYNSLIGLIQKRWKPSLLNGLVFCLLYNWSSYEYGIVSKGFRSFILDKLSNYEGKRKHLCEMKSNNVFLRDGGSLALGQSLVSNQKSILEAPVYIGLKKRDFGYSYFSKTIQYYFKNKSRTNIAELEETLTLHANSATTKIVISDKIIKANELQDGSSSVNTIKRIALKLVGDPFVRANWNTIGVAQEQAEQINTAYSILKKWMIKSFINLAFQHLINDPARKVFWLKYVDYIDDLKIVGNQHHKYIISNQPELNEALGNCFRQQTSRSVSNTCAIAIQIRNHYFFEFSDVGACYVYADNSKMSMIENGINKVDELKEPRLNNLIVPISSYYSNYFDSGRFIHSGAWQSRLNRWFQIKLGIYV